MAASVELQQQVDALKLFLANAPSNWDLEDTIRRFLLPNGEYISCVLWKNLFHVTGTDIVRALIFRFQAFGRPIRNMKKFEEGVFSDLRNLKPGQDATLEGPRSEFLELLFKNNCIRTQKKQKVFYWFSVPHERLFTEALERDLKRESLGQEPITVAVSAEEASAGLLPATLVSSARRTTTPLPTLPTPSNAPSYNSSPPVLSTPIMNSVLASTPLGMHGSPWNQPIPDPLASTSDEWMADAMNDWIADDAPLALNEDMPRISRSASWNDDMMHKPAYAQQSEEYSMTSQPLLSPTFSDASSYQTQYFNFGEKIPRSNSSLSSLLSQDQGYGSFDDTNKIKHPRSNSSLSSLLSQDQGYGSFDDTNKIKHPQDASKHLQSSPTISAHHVNHVLSKFDFAPTHIDPSILSKKAAGAHPRAHSFSHNISTSSSVSSNPLFGKYSMFDNSPNYKHRRRSSLLSADDSRHRRSYSSASETTSKESSPVPGMDGESRVARRSWNCDFDNCGRMFKRYEHLKRHYRTHTKERPYVCDFKGCGKPFSRSDNLAQHIRIHQKMCKSEEDTICVKSEGDEIMQDSDGSPDPEEMRDGRMKRL